MINIKCSCFEYSIICSKSSFSVVMLPKILRSIDCSSSFCHCWHKMGSKICGTIYQKELNEHKIAEFKRTAEYTDICDTCPVRPNCYRLEKCPDKNKVCNEDFKIFCIENVKERMITTYNEWKSEQ